MDKKEFEVAMHRIAEAAPKEASPEVMSLIVANLVLLFEQQQQWPSIMMAVTAVLSEAIKEDREEATEKDEDVALRDANNFMAAIIQKRHLH
tara:strand:- start:215 stop:490 length:276 start_codon:yes stop_codon:yes gene_type:complete